MKQGRAFVAVSAIVVALWLGCWILTQRWPDKGAFGDSFGAVSALFSGFAFAALVFTIMLQREELRLQREELKHQQTEMVETRKLLRAQAEAQDAQARDGCPAESGLNAGGVRPTQPGGHVDQHAAPWSPAPLREQHAGHRFRYQIDCQRARLCAAGDGPASPAAWRPGAGSARPCTQRQPPRHS